MKVKELIKQLSEFNQDLEIKINLEVKEKIKESENYFYNALDLINLEEQTPFKEVWFNCTLEK